MASTSSSVKDLIISHFDAHQRRSLSENGREGARFSANKKITNINVEARAALLKKEISNRLASTDAVKKRNIRLDRSGALFNDENEDPRPYKGKDYVIDNEEQHEDAIREEITGAILQCVHAAFYSSTNPSISSSTGHSTSNGCSGQTEEAVARVFELAAAFCANPVSSEFFYLNYKSFSALWEIAIQSSQAALESVRSNGCQLIGLCLKYLFAPLPHEEIENGGDDEQEQNDKEEWTRKCNIIAEKALLPRLTDKSQSVRNSAIRACAYFFSFEAKQNKSFEIESALLRSLVHDPSFANRSAAFESIPISNKSIPQIIERVRDVKDRTRVNALEILKNKVDVKMLSEEQRIDILRAGLTERCALTHAAASKMLCCGWMKSLKFDPVELLRMLDLPGNETVCEIAIKTVIGAAAVSDESSSFNSTLKELSDPETREYREKVVAPIDIQEDNFDSASAFMLRIRCNLILDSETLTEGQRCDQIGKAILPDLLVLSEVLQKHLHSFITSVSNRVDSDGVEDSEESDILEEEEWFICLQLLHLAKRADQEEAGRRHFLSLMHDMLSSPETPDDLIEACIKAMSGMHSSEHDFICRIAEIVNEVEGETFEQEDASCQIRVLSILSVVLEHSRRQMKDAPVLSGFSGSILPCIMSPETLVREAAVSCLGKYALLSDNTTVSAEFKPLLLKIAESEQEVIEVRAQAILALSDLALLFDSMFDPCPSTADNEELPSLTVLLSRLLVHRKVGMVVISAEACAKLLLAGKIHDPKITARLLVIFFEVDDAIKCIHDFADEAAEVGSPVRLEQLLSIFFHVFGMRSAESRATLTQSVKPMLRILEKKGTSGTKKKSSGSLPVGKMIQYVCSTVSNGESAASSLSNRDEEEENNLGKEHDTKQLKSSVMLSVLIDISEFLIEESWSLSSTYLRALCKVLGGVSVDDLEGDIARLKNLQEEIGMLITDTVALKSAGKLMELIKTNFSLEDNGEECASVDEFTESESAERDVASNFDIKDSEGEKVNVMDATKAEEFIGKKIAKDFQGDIFFGTVAEHFIDDETDASCWHIKYDDGDSEDFDVKDLMEGCKLYKITKENPTS